VISARQGRGPRRKCETGRAGGGEGVEIRIQGQPALNNLRERNTQNEPPKEKSSRTSSARPKEGKDSRGRNTNKSKTLLQYARRGGRLSTKMHYEQLSLNVG